LNKGRISGKHLTISTKKIVYSEDKIFYWTQESFATKKVRSAVSNAIAFMKSRKNLAVFQNTSGHLQMEHHQPPKSPYRSPPLAHFLISTDLKSVVLSL
jgi:hypothetical protein